MSKPTFAKNPTLTSLDELLGYKKQLRQAARPVPPNYSVFVEILYDDIDQGELFASIVDDPVPIPDGTAADASDLISRLCDKSPQNRLGSRQENEVIEHAWFQGMDLGALLSRKVAPPWKPDVSGPLDSRNFQPDEEDQVDFPDRPLSKRDAQLFEGVF